MSSKRAIFSARDSLALPFVGPSSPLALALSPLIEGGL